MNVLYLIHTLKTNKMPQVVEHIDLPPLDINLSLWEAEERGDISINDKKERIDVLKEYEMWHDEELAAKILKVVKRYSDKGHALNRGRLYGYMKDPMTNVGYKTHEYLMTLQYLIDTKVLAEYTVSVPKTKDRPYHKFVFIHRVGEDIEERASKAVNKFVDTYKSKKVK